MASSRSQLTHPRYKIPTSRRLGLGADRRFVVLGFISLLLFGFITPRLVYLQILEGNRNLELAEENRIRLIPEAPERGKILDRKGRVLADSQSVYSLFIWPSALKKKKWPHTVAILAKVLDTTPAEIERRVKEEGEASLYLSRIAQNLNFSQVVALAERSNEMIGVRLVKEAVRHYPHGELASHVLGYVGEVSEEELKERADKGYRLGDIVGQLGIEYAYEERLHGTWGGQQVEVNGAGQVVRILGEKVSLAGETITLTLDLDVQRAAEAALGDRQGAIVAIDPRDGSILAMASHPGFNPNWFAKSITEEQWQILQKRSYPFVNRALQGFPPASTFKLVTATAGLESGKFRPDDILMTYAEIHGVGDWNRAGFGPIGFVTALQWSSNTFFGQVGVKSTPETLIDWAHRYGAGSKTGIDIPGESAGFIPTPAWKLEQIGDPWAPADTVMTSIGQGAVQVSPLQAAIIYSVPANGGFRIHPHLLKGPNAPNFPPVPLNLKPDTLKVIRTGLRAVVTSGTGTALNVPELPPAAGKSGTGEDPPRQVHTWFGGYAPFDKPEIVVVAFGENSGGGGGAIAGPMVRQVMTAYFKHNPLKAPAKPPPKPQLPIQ